MKATAACLLLALGLSSFPIQGLAQSFLVDDGQPRAQITVLQTPPPQYPEAVRDVEPPLQPVHRTWFIDDPLPEGASPVFRDKMNNMLANCIDTEAERKTEGIWAGLRRSEHFGMYAVWGLVSPDSEHTDNELLGEMLNTWMDEWYPAEAGELEAGWKAWHLYGPLVEITARPKLKAIVGAERLDRAVQRLLEDARDLAERRWPNAIEKAVEIVNFGGHGDVAALTLGWVLTREYEPDFAPALFERAAFAMRMMDWHMGPNGTIRYLYNPDFKEPQLVAETMYYHNINIRFTNLHIAGWRKPEAMIDIREDAAAAAGTYKPHNQRTTWRSTHVTGPWRIHQAWLYLPDRIIGLMTLRATDTTEARSAEHIYRLMSEEVTSAGDGAYDAGDIRLTIVDTNLPYQLTEPGRKYSMSTKEPWRQIVLADRPRPTKPEARDMAGDKEELLPMQSYAAGDVFYSLVEVRQIDASPARIELISFDDGLLAFGATVDGRAHLTAANFAAEGNDRTVQWNGKSVEVAAGSIADLDRGPGKD